MEDKEEVSSALEVALEQLFKHHGVDVHVEKSVPGPSVVRVEITLGPTTKVEDLLKLAKTIGYTVGSDHVRIQTPVPGRSVIGIEVPRVDRQVVRLDMAALDGAHPLTLPIGVTTDWTLVTAELPDLPHMLVAGATGSGKSTWVNVALTTLIRRNDPGVLRLALIDPKVVELAAYATVPHLWDGHEIATTMETALQLSEDLCAEMERRYVAMADAGVKNIDAYNARADEPWPYIVLLCDELADFMLADKKAKGKPFEDALVRLAQKARAAGIYCILATQRPSVDVVTGLLKTNIPARLGLRVATMPDSRVILDQTGAQHLLPHGDGLWLAPGRDGLVRVQSPYVGDDEIAAVVADAVKQYAEPEPEPEWPVNETPEPPPVQRTVRVPKRVTRVVSGITPTPIELASQPVKDPFAVGKDWVPYLP